jgi:hypothetical protein
VVGAGVMVLGVEAGGGGFSPAVDGGVLDVLVEPGEVGPGVGGPPPPPPPPGGPTTLLGGCWAGGPPG